MKIRVTEIEATAAELRACNTLGDGVANILRDLLNYPRPDDVDPGDQEPELSGEASDDEA